MTSWHDHAACAGLAPLFDANDNGGATREAVAARYARYARCAAVCARCPVQAACEADAEPGRDEGFRAGRVLPPLYLMKRKRAA